MAKPSPRGLQRCMAKPTDILELILYGRFLVLYKTAGRQVQINAKIYKLYSLYITYEFRDKL